MLSRWFHAPRLHAPAHHGHTKKVGWLELFYDLIFVASIIQLGNFLAQHADAGGFGLFAMHFMPLWMAWSGFTFYANRFTVDDVVHRLLVMGKMFAVGAMAMASVPAMEGRPTLFALAYALTCALLGVMYWRAYRQVEEGRDYSRYWGGVFVASGATFGVSVLLPVPWNYLLWAVGMGIILVSPASKPARELSERHPIDMEHLTERYGLLTLIVLGESFVKVLSFLTESGLGEQLTYQLRGFFNLGITCSLWWVYFDDVAGSELKKSTSSFMAWLYGHLPLALGLTSVGVAVKMAIKIGAHEAAPDGVRWLLAGSLAMVLLSVALIDSVTERPHVEINERVRIAIRWVAALVLLLVAAVGGSMSGGVFLGIVTAICAAQVLLDLMMAPQAMGHHGPEVTSTADAARLRRDGSAPPIPAGPLRDVGEAVRLGAPSELRRDLYFFFLEGSWSRLLLTLVCAYLGLNVVFAGLFMLEPSGVGGAETPGFSEAFFLSVQTLATIGYGVLHPRSDWAHFVVTVEAATGMLFAAMATGTVLAKATRARAGVMIANDAVVCPHNGVPTLMLRAANARGNDVVEASVSVSAIMDTLSAEGQHIRRVLDLKLVRSRQPMFALSWTIMHPIDADSPLHGIDLHNSRDLLAVVVTLMGHDGTYGQTIYTRKTYAPKNIRVNHRYVDIMGELPDGRLVIDLARFHQTEPLPPPATA